SLSFSGETEGGETETERFSVRELGLTESETEAERGREKPKSTADLTNCTKRNLLNADRTPSNICTHTHTHTHNETHTHTHKSNTKHTQPNTSNTHTHIYHRQ